MQHVAHRCSGRSAAGVERRRPAPYLPLRHPGAAAHPHRVEGGRHGQPVWGARDGQPQGRSLRGVPGLAPTPPRRRHRSRSPPQSLSPSPLASERPQPPHEARPRHHHRRRAAGRRRRAAAVGQGDGAGHLLPRCMPSHGAPLLPPQAGGLLCQPAHPSHPLSPTLSLTHPTTLAHLHIQLCRRRARLCALACRPPGDRRLLPAPGPGGTPAGGAPAAVAASLPAAPAGATAVLYWWARAQSTPHLVPPASLPCCTVPGREDRVPAAALQPAAHRGGAGVLVPAGAVLVGAVRARCGGSMQGCGGVWGGVGWDVRREPRE